MTNDRHQDTMPEEPDLSRTYRDATREVPPAPLDAEILAAARHAVEGERVPRRSAKRWAVPVSLAAIIVLSVGVVLRLTDRGTFDQEVSMRAPADAPPPTAPSTAAKPEAETRAKGYAPARESRGPAAAAPSSLYKEEEVKREGNAATRRVEPWAAQKAEADRLREMQDRTSPAAGLITAKEKKAMSDKADVIAVQVSGSPGAYEFNVTIRSPDTGCNQYADWWEVVSEDGKLLYRRVLLHSHVDEQPFTRSGGPVPVQPGTVVWVRAHMAMTGYGGEGFRGSAKEGFGKAELPSGFGTSLANEPPLPDGCAF